MTYSFTNCHWKLLTDYQRIVHTDGFITNYLSVQAECFPVELLTYILLREGGNLRIDL